MMKKSVLMLLDISKPFELQMDALDFALEGVLLQEGHLVAFENRKLFEAERRYREKEKELLPVIHCLQTWRH